MYINKSHKFSIVLPAYGVSDECNQDLIAVFYGPSRVAGLINNVTIMTQKCCTTRDKYLKQSLEQFKRLGARLISHSDLSICNCDGKLFEYNMIMNSGIMRCLSLAVIEDNRVLLITASAPESVFDEFRDQYLACLQSFAITEE